MRPCVGPGWESERRASSRGYRAIAGIDEAGRGALAGPVVAAAVVLEAGRCPEGVRDSKTLSAASRNRLFEEIVRAARGWGIGLADAAEIDGSNILRATRSAMVRAVAALPMKPDFLLVDALPLPELGIPFEAPFKGDRDIVSVAAASILAKVTRDRILAELDLQFRGYGFALHKGYGTPSHFEAIGTLGPSPAHRRSFAGLGSGSLFGGPAAPDGIELGRPEAAPTQGGARSLHSLSVPNGAKVENAGQ